MSELNLSDYFVTENPEAFSVGTPPSTCPPVSTTCPCKQGSTSDPFTLNVCADTDKNITGTILCPGSFLNVTVTFNCVCPGKKIALAVVVKNSTTDEVLGVEFCKPTVPGMIGDPCKTLTVDGFRFPIPQDPCNPITCKVSIIACYASL